MTDTLKIRVIREYEFRRSTNTAQTACNINNVYGENYINERTTRYLFARFHSGNFDLKNEPCGRPDTLVNNDELTVIVVADDIQSTAKLAAAFDVSIKTILVHLRQISKLGSIAGMLFRKFTGQKDVSEYCRRRVLPSVFLGRHVLDANSHILHFTRLELPYSCSVSVRAESGSNIILVIQYLSNDSLANSCTNNKHQLLVYEIGETFGGYWGPLPDSIMKQESNFTQIYTIQSTEPTTTIDYKDESESHEENDSKSDAKNSTLKLPHNIEKISTGDYIEVEIPLVNVSGNFASAHFPFGHIDVLDLLEDDKPRNGVVYDTSIMPLLQFSMDKAFEGFASGFSPEKLQFLSAHLPKLYTPDARLTYGTKYRRTKYRKKNTVFAKRRHNFNKTPSTFVAYDKTKKKEYYTHILPHVLPSTRSTGDLKNVSLPLPEITISYLTKPREIIDSIIKSLHQITQANETHNILVQKILDSRNTSAYLYPNISDNDSFVSIPPITKTDSTQHFINFTTELSATPIISDSSALLELFESSQLITNKYTKTATEALSTNSLFLNGIEKHTELFNISVVSNTSATVYNNQTSDSSSLVTANDTVDKLKKERINHSINGTTKSNNKHANMVTGSMVNHESWENVVQAAPVMAVLLNKTLPQAIHKMANRPNQENIDTLKEVQTQKHSFSRKKRYIKPLAINNARPRVLTTRQDFITFKGVEEFNDVQDIAHLVELQDDEIQGRVALRYMRNYVGSVLFNICDYSEPKARHVYLFNTSRIVIAITNFTLERMTLVMTPARTLRSKETNCPPAHLECQVSGARVCIDSMSACDGIPNCGSNDIYDEDRLACGRGSGLQHNVYLAAGTFLAVLLIVLYSIHYWLKRCVPGVSEAFFVYSDKSENMLNLETIMQSPNDDDSKTDRTGYFLYDDGLDIDTEVTIKRNFLKRFWHIVCTRCFKKQTLEIQKEELEDSIDKISYQPPVKRLYSFAELELSRISGKKSTDAGVQTGDSLEKAYLTSLQMKKIGRKRSIDIDGRNKFKKEKHELNVIKFLKESRSESIQSVVTAENNTLPEQKVSKNIQSNWTPDEEKELLSTVYEPGASVSQKDDHRGMAYERRDRHRELAYSERSALGVRKHLRFDEEARTIPSLQSDDEAVVGEESNKPPIVFGTEKLRYSVTDDNIEGNTNSTGKEFIRFWTGAKGKRSKHKKHDK